MTPIVINILDLIDIGGRAVIERKLATFSSPKNPEIEDFIKNKAINFATGNYMASSFLLAQFGKNYALDKANRIDGSELMRLATDVLINIQRQIGGGIVYLDCEDKEVLTSFYKKQNFKEFDDRFSSEDNKKYIQFMRFF